MKFTASTLSVSRYFGKRERSRLRKAMRGYRILKSEGRLNNINSVQQLIARTALKPRKSAQSGLVFGAAVDSSELVVRQYLLSRLAGRKLNYSLLESAGRGKGKVSIACPKEWRTIMRSGGFNISETKSLVRWNGLIVLYWCFGLFKIFKNLLDPLSNRNSLERHPSNYAYFNGLVEANLPNSNNYNYSYNIITWYLGWAGRSRNVETVCHSVKSCGRQELGGAAMEYLPAPIPRLETIREVILYFVWSAQTVTTTLCHLLKGDWWSSMILSESALLAKIRIIPAEKLATEYLFSNSNTTYRPLWSYEAESAGSLVFLYFYSTNCEGFKRPEAYPPPDSQYLCITWTNYLVWDSFQHDFVRRVAGGKAVVKVVGPIWFSDSSRTNKDYPPNLVAVFDVQPARDSFYRTHCFEFDYYIPGIANRFLMEILEVCIEHDCKMALKRKRDIGNLAHPRYRKMIDDLVIDNNCICIESNVNAIRLIKESIAVISTPFTSTAILAQKLGKPSVYFDPLSLLQENDRGAHGIRVINDKNRLAEWLSLEVRH